LTRYLIENTPIFKIMCTILKVVYLHKTDPAKTEAFFSLDSFLDFMETTSAHYQKLNCDSDAFKSKRAFLVPNTIRYLVSGYYLNLIR
jgi:hypothetical protein